MSAVTPEQLDKLTEVFPYGKVWESGSKRRFYPNVRPDEVPGFYVSYYGTGNISYASVDGEKISNTSAGKICADLKRGYVDLATGEVKIERWIALMPLVEQIESALASGESNE